MARQLIQSNPFILMMDPQAVLSQIEHSERLERLQRRVCRPLDKPQLGTATPAPHLQAHDRAIDSERDEVE